jgi:leucyl/phenylalanyl-tRNA---protein transferase
VRATVSAPSIGWHFDKQVLADWTGHRSTPESTVPAV